MVWHLNDTGHIAEHNNIDDTLATLSGELAALYTRPQNGIPESDLAPALQAKIDGAEQVANKNVANGYAQLDSNTKILHSYLPAIAESDITNLVNDLTLLAPKANPTLTGTVTVPTPTSPTSAVTKQYADGLAQGLTLKQQVRAIGLTNVTLTGAQTVDTVALNVGDRVLLVGQSNPVQNGLWLVQSSSWTRPTDWATNSVQLSTAVYVAEGSADNISTTWATFGSSITVDTTAESWTTFAAAADLTFSSPLNRSGNNITIGNATSSILGVIQIAGDLGGTATSPTIPALANKANNSIQIITGAGLTGGGDLTSNRTIAVVYGTTSNTAAQGNDARLSDQRTPLNGSVTDAKIAPGGLSESSLSSAVQAKLDNAQGIGTNAWLISNVNSVTYTSVTRDSNEAITTASVKWPDGTTGTLTTDVASSSFPGVVDAYHITYAGTPTKTITQALVTRDSFGEVSAQPALTVS